MKYKIFHGTPLTVAEFVKIFPRQAMICWTDGYVIHNHMVGWGAKEGSLKISITKWEIFTLPTL